mmetsp:Transcript_92794/g.178129  ORF Transcript_92794/g.178129 Transcript_92794/m.178129 type:complete len:815 (+) Transcript_92794:53-2497(+)
MMRESVLYILYRIATIALCGSPYQEPAQVDDLLRHVDVFIGTDRGNTFPGATVPFGMVQLSPIVAAFTKSGYAQTQRLNATTLAGFGLTALSGTGLGAGGDFLLLPAVTAGDLLFSPAASLVHNGQRASPGYYSADVNMYQPFPANFTVRLTAQKRSGMLHIKFKSRQKFKSRHKNFQPANLQPTLLLKLRSPLDNVRDCNASQNSDHAVVASREAFSAQHWNIKHASHAAFETSSPIISFRKMEGACVWQLTFNESVQELFVRVGLSYVDTVGAQGNLYAELGAKSEFDEVWSRARQDWQGALGRAKISASEEVLTRFYSALYHTMLGPTLFSDHDRRFRLGGYGDIMTATFDFYSTFSLWDTYRAEHSLINLLFPELASHFVQSLLTIQKVGGRLPRWVLYGLDTLIMIGYPAVNVISEIALKGLLRHTPDLELDAYQHLLEASKKQVDKGVKIDRLVPILDDVPESMSKALEYAWSDSCLSRLAGKLGDKTSQQHYFGRSQLYRLYYNDNSKMLLPRNVTGSIELAGDTMDKKSVKYYREGTPRGYTFMVPHDVPGLVELFGGEKALEVGLDTYFGGRLRDKTKCRDMETGRLGGHVQGNEPGHHIPYLYNSAGAPWKTQDTVDKLMAMYTTGNDGLPGDDDVGQMSAWFVFSALGFYPVDPCDGTYTVGRPLVEEALLKLERGTLHLAAYNQSLGNKFVSAASWNSGPLQGTSLQHEDLVRGGELLFELNEHPSDFRGKTPRARQSSSTDPAALHEMTLGDDEKGINRIDELPAKMPGGRQIGSARSVMRHRPEDAAAKKSLMRSMQRTA